MFLKKTKKDLTHTLIRDINQQVFEIMLVSFLLFYLLDQILANIISNYFNLNIILIIVIISGVIMNLAASSPDKETKKTGLCDYLLIFGLGLVAFVVIYYKLDLISWLRLAISVISSMIIILLSMLLLNDNNEQNL